MNKNKFRLILRYGLDPFNAVEENFRRLVEFAKDSRIHEVMFLIAPEERSCGHITMEEAQPWIDAIKTVKPMLAKEKVEVSLNPWTTTYHAGRGRHLHPGQDFRLMIGETGANNGISPCPFDENWQKYLIEYYSHLAREIDPVALWIEDDWRLHNHGAEMGYGGCFCEVCLAKFSKLVGEAVTRQQVLANVLHTGTPHPWRAKWMELAQAALLEPAVKLAAALKAVRPKMRLGLMSSIPDVHSVENRDWQKLMDVWSGNDRYLIRPHMPPYTETHPMTTWPSFTRHTIANLDKPTDIYPELENSPRCGPYSGSHTYSAWEIHNSIMLGSRGITINHFDNMGMNTYYDRGLAKALGARRKTFDALMPLNITDRNAHGVQILFSPEVATHRHTTSGASLNGLVNDSVGWSGVFYVLGISHGFTKVINKDTDTLYAVSDQTVHALSEAQIKQLLAHPVLLDFPSAQILVERGFGKLIGVQSAAMTTLNDKGYSFEEIDTKFFGEIEGGVKPRMCAQRNSDPIGILTYLPQTEVLSHILKADSTECFPGSGLFVNELGGIIFTTAYTLGKAQFYMAYFNVVRQQFFTKLLFAMANAKSDITIVSGHPLQLHAVNLKRGIFCGLTNVSYDATKQFTLHLKAQQINGKSFRALSDTGKWQKLTPAIAVAGEIATVTIKKALHPLQSLFLVIE